MENYTTNKLEQINIVILEEIIIIILEQIINLIIEYNYGELYNK